MRNDLTTPYSDYRQPDPLSEDFRNVLAWLKTHGAPEPTISYYFLDNTGYPNGGNPGKQMLLTFGPESTPRTTMDAAIVMNIPGAALLMLDLVKNGILYEPPKPPVAPPAPVTQPANPIGLLWFKSRDGVNTFYPAPGDTTPDRALWPDPTTSPVHLFMKSVIPGPFGPTAYWEQIR